MELNVISLANSVASQLVIDCLRLILALMWTILCIRIVWRVEKKLDIFFKLLSLAGILIVVRQLVRVLERLAIIESNFFGVILELLPTTMVVIALLVMNNLITKLDREK